LTGSKAAISIRLDREGKVYHRQVYLLKSSTVVLPCWWPTRKRQDWLKIAENGANFLPNTGEMLTVTGTLHLNRDGNHWCSPYKHLSDCFGSHGVQQICPGSQVMTGQAGCSIAGQRFAPQAKPQLSNTAIRLYPGINARCETTGSADDFS